MLQVYSYADLKLLLNESLAGHKTSLFAGSDEIQNLMKQSQELLGAAPAAESWLRYIQDMSEFVITSLTEMLRHSFTYLHSQVSLCHIS